MSGQPDTGESQPRAAASFSLPAPVLLSSEPIGTYLATHRRLRGISLAELADATRIPLRSLERLESGAFDGQSDGFVRGFVRTVALALGLDAEEAVARVRHEPGDARMRSRARLSLRRVFHALTLVAGLALVMVLAAAALRRESAGVEEAIDPIVIRRDPVRALAEAQGVEGLHPKETILRGAHSLAVDLAAPEPALVLSEPSDPSRPLSRGP